jgi:hypothetical protein
MHLATAGHATHPVATGAQPTRSPLTSPPRMARSHASITSRSPNCRVEKSAVWCARSGGYRAACCAWGNPCRNMR